jgi:hypothetical protein
MVTIKKLYARALLSLVLLGLTACQDAQLPTIGRTLGDFPMASILTFQNDKNCYNFENKIYFESDFAEGMAFAANTCLGGDKKIGQKTVADIANMHVSITYDGEYYIIKSGY